MDSGKFYFIKDEYFEKYSDCGLMGNKDNGAGRPCYYCIKDDSFYWMVPISSKIEKYHRLYEEKTKRYPNYDGVRFGYVLGRESAFLLQNVCPITEKYIANVYRIEKGTVDVEINETLSKELKRICRKIINMNKKGVRITITDINKIMDGLREEN